jgi:hypothetical protein
MVGFGAVLVSIDVRGLSGLASSQIPPCGVASMLSSQPEQSSGKVFIVSYWAGALGALLSHEVDPTTKVYDSAKNTLNCLFLKRR